MQQVILSALMYVVKWTNCRKLFVKTVKRDCHITFHSYWIAFIRQRITSSYCFLAVLKHKKQDLTFSSLFFSLSVSLALPITSVLCDLFVSFLYLSCLHSLFWLNQLAIALKAQHQFLGWFSLQLSHSSLTVFFLHIRSMAVNTLHFLVLHSLAVLTYSTF